jgi:hypothetical protein
MPAYVADARPTWPESIVDTAKSISLTKKARERFWLHVAHNLTNSLASVNAMELRWAEAHGLPKHLLSAKDSAAKLGQMASDDGGRMAVAMEKAAMLWDARAGIARPHPTVKGLHWVAESLKTPEDYADATAYVYALRASRLIGEERENLMTEADIAAGLARGTPAALQFAERWEQFNDAMLQFAVDTGVLSPEQKASYQQYFYVPFYRQYEATGELMGPNELRRGLNNPSLRIHRLEGGTSKLGDLFENIVKNTATVVSAGVRNVAMQRIHGMLTDLGEAVDIPHWQEPKGDDVVSFYEEGKRRWFRPDDDLMFAALSGMRPETVNGVVRSLQKFSNMYRRGVTATPPFMLRNWIKGIVGTWIQTGRNVSLTTNSFTGMAAYAADDPIVDAIRAATGFGAYAFGEGGGMSGRHLRRKTFENKGFFGQVVKFWEGWEHVGEATEMADRIALAQNLLKAGVDEAEAYYQAANVMPYSRHGAAPWVRFLTLTVPFLNARLQGLARMIDTTSSVDARGRLAKRIILRGIIMTGFTAALWAINNSDEDKKRKYDRMTPDQRLMYWPLFLGDLMIKIPKPFEFGHVFATAMELALDAAYKDQGPHDALVVGLGALQQTFGFDTYVPLPQALVPALEVATNWDFWRQRPIENLGVSRLPPEQRTGPSVSSTAEAIAMGVDNILPNTVSPLQVEHLINGYLGIGGKVVTGIFDAIAGNLGFAPQRPSGVFGSGLPAGIASITGLDALVSRADVPLWDRWVEDFYRVKNLADEQYSGARAYALQGKIDDARDLIKDNPTLFRMRPIFNQAEAQLSKISQAMRQIRASELSGEEKRRRLDPLVKARNTTAETIMRTFNRVQANAGRRAA